MQVIEELLYQKTAQGLDWFFSVWWYWLPAGIGFLFRFGLLKYKICDPEMRVKAILKDIGIVFGLTILWSSMNSAGLDDNAAVMLIILTFVYIFYGLAESCEDTGGTTESLLLIIKSVFVTMLSFQTIWGTLFGAVLTGVLAVLAYKFWFGVEKKTDLFEIIFLCVEAVGLSIYGEFHDIQGIGVLLFVFYEETAFFLLNYLVKEGAARYFGEEEDY
ncbi:hypothetical protein [Hungatella hathewayi]|uniref:hypothetical protein n=1 Tax=Hungatella hathewayi TaxID=154046 RepID=UPI0011DD12AD|nr:hypothetical protein [Hungatella hathewayi]